MLFSTSSYLSVLALASVSVAQKCKLQFDARVPCGSTPASFDDKSSGFNPDFTKGANVKFSELVKLPNVTRSLFDKNTLPFEVTLSDKSIFNNQTGFRRAELMPLSVSGTDNSTVGVKTLHFSVQADKFKPLNTSHEYQLVFLEDNTFSTNQFVLKTGTILDQTTNKDDLVIFGNVNDAAPGKLFNTPFTAGTFHNFAVTMDFTKNTIAVFYSQGSDALKQVVAPTANDLSGQGQFHFGALKKPVGGTGDITKNGFQPNGIDEGVIFGGIFEEDSADGCMSLSA